RGGGPRRARPPAGAAREPGGRNGARAVARRARGDVPAPRQPAAPGGGNRGPTMNGVCGRAGLIEVVEDKLDARGGVAPEDLLHQVRIALAERRQQVAVV